MVEYRIHSIRQAVKLELPDAQDYTDSDYDFGIWLYEDGIATRFIGSDGGEPEDMTLGRDFCWVEPELNYAYQRGLKDASNE